MSLFKINYGYKLKISLSLKQVKKSSKTIKERVKTLIKLYIKIYKKVLQFKSI
jgi:hypothetical protein